MNRSSYESIIEEWIDWEIEEELHSPRRIEKGEDRSKHLQYAFDRMEKEIEEAREVADAVDDFQQEDEIDEDILDYTTKIDRAYKDVDRQVKDELGYEIADVTLFLMKAATTLEFYETGRSTDYSDISEIFDGREEIEEFCYDDILDEIHQVYNPEIEGSFANQEVLQDNLEDEKIASQLQKTGTRLKEITRDLPRSLQEYLGEKIGYNKEREIEKMDADFELREKWKKNSVNS